MKNIVIALLLLLILCAPAIAQKLLVYDLTCEARQNPVGVAVAVPRVSWKIKVDGRDILQTAYSIRVFLTPQFNTKSVVVETGKINSGESVLQPINGLNVKSATRYHWQVKIWDNKDRESAWSDVAFFETGLSPADWKAEWIEPVQDTTRNLPGLLVRKEFALDKPISKARAYVTAHGLYELHVNGKVVGDEVLMPGWTSYKKRLQYQVYDVTKNLQQGKNAIGAIIGEGWYRGTLGWSDNWGVWGKRLGLLGQIIITYTDGSTVSIITDNTWKSSSDSPVLMNSIYDGEHYDARKEQPGWDAVNFNDASWKPVAAAKYDNANLVETETVPLKRIEELKPVKIFRSPKGTLIADFGQNMVGWVRLKVKGPAGTKITLRHAEVLDKHGEFYTENLRGAKATMVYMLRGSGDETYEPKFTFFGFRYIAIEGWPGEVTNENITGIVVHSEMKPTGTFECSNPLVNQLQQNIIWGQKGNFLDVPTDCPQRDERLGWTGDAQAFSRTAAFNMQVQAFFTKWLKDLEADQLDNGIVPPVIPNIMLDNLAGSAGWADASTIIPWNMYLVYGDKKILENQYESMKKWVGYMTAQSTDHLWNKGFHFGDWLFYRPFDDLDGRTAVTDKYMIAQCFWAHSTQLLINTATLLGKTEDVQEYTRLLGQIKEAYLREYMTSTGRLVSGTQTAYVLALNFDMLPENLRAQAVDRLVKNVKDYGNHLTTGFLGTPYLCHVLTRFGHTDLAYTLLLQETYPSWLYPVKMGATTIWERWDGQKTDSTFQNPGMNSFNHYAYGAIGEWMYRVVAGIEIEEPGYKKIRIQPQPDARLTYATASFDSNYGTITSGWKMNDGQMTVSVSVPANSTAIIVLPKAKANEVKERGQTIAGKREYRNVKEDNGAVRFETGSGNYEFTYPVR